LNSFQKIKVFTLDTLFPIHCISCNYEGLWLCEECLEKIPLKQEWTCPICEKNITPGGRVCFHCRKKSFLDGLLVAASYKENLISSAVHYLKYRFAKDLYIPLGKILTKALNNSGLPLPEIIVPVPLHKRRLRWRGFNQSELLAEYLGENLTPGFSIPIFNNLLIRKKYTQPQMKIKNYFRRKKNIENAFMIDTSSMSFSPLIRGDAPKGQRGQEYGMKKENFLKNKKILLIDDIATTGSTLFECAKVLKSAGAAEVFASVIARQENKK